MKKYFLYFWAIAKARVLRRRVPILVTLCVTNRCNMRCAYCYHEQHYDGAQQKLPTERVLALVDELASLGTRYVSINGGEALLLKDLERIVDKVRSRGLLLHLSTNGLLVPQRLAVLKKIDSIAISIDGIGPNNDLNRGAGSYVKIRQGLEALRQARIKFHTHTVLTKNNKDAVDQILPLARSYGFKAQFSLLRLEDSPDKTLGLSAEEVVALVTKIRERRLQGDPVFFSDEAYENYLAWPLSGDQQILRDKIPAGFKPIPCYIKRFACHIEANGNVYPCVVLVNKTAAPNVLDQGFRECWEALAATSCLACRNICCNDLNLIFGLNPRSLANAVKIVLDRMTRRC